jgi:phosphopantetheinyl transferase
VYKRQRRILGGCVDRDPAQLAFTIDAHGKPHLSDGPPFNLSHSGPWAVAAIGNAGAVGIDVESAERVGDPVALARRYFHPGEAAVVAADPTRFATLWAAKEAVVKCLGVGLQQPLDRFRIGWDDDGALRLAEPDPVVPAMRTMTVQAMPPLAGAPVVVAVAPGPRRIVAGRWRCMR